MTQELELYLTIDQFKRFIEAVPKLEVFHEDRQKPPMSAYEFQVYFACAYYLCWRPGAEAKRAMVADFDLDNRIAKVSNQKGGYSKTTIPPPLIPILQEYFKTHQEYLFKGERQTFWKYTKAIGVLANIDYFEEFEKRQIKGLYLYVFKHAYIQRLDDMKCPGSLISIKSRHKPEGMAGQTVGYAKRIKGLIAWENNNITEQLTIEARS